MKLKDDPAVQALLTKAADAATAAATAVYSKARRELKRELKELIATHGNDAKVAGNPDGKARLAALGANVLAKL